MIRLISALFLLFAVPAVAATLSPEAIANEIAAHGADAVVARLAKSGDYDRVLGHIDSGDARWVRLAPKLAPGADAGNAEALIISLAFALPRNAKAVLAVLGGKEGFAVEDVCSAPFIEDTVKDVPGYVKRAEAAVARVSDAALKPAKDACLLQLHKA